MIFTRADFPHIRRSLLVFLSVLCAGAAAIAASKNFIIRAQLEQQAAQRQLNAARGQFATAEEDRRNMNTYTQEYGRLLERNIIGNDNRLDWIEGLEKIRKQNRVLDFKYAISPQQPYLPSLPLDSGNFELKLSGMTLRFNLLHEGQLLNFFDALRADIKGRFILDHCTLERGADSNALPQLEAECAGGWLTLKGGGEK